MTTAFMPALPLAAPAAGYVPAPYFDPARVDQIYRARARALLRRYYRIALATGRMPCLLGGDVFRARITRYSGITFEDRMIFVHDVEACLGRLDDFAQKILARMILEEWTGRETAHLEGCCAKTARRTCRRALQDLSDVLLERRLLEPLENPD